MELDVPTADPPTNAAAALGDYDLPDSGPILRPLHELGSFTLDRGHGAGLLCNDGRSWTTGVLLGLDVDFRDIIQGEPDDERDDGTLYELLKLAGRLRTRHLESELSQSGTNEMSLRVSAQILYIMVHITFVFG